MKVHLNLATDDMAGSIAFYSTLLGAAPAKVLPDYALFVTEAPGLELALDRTDAVAVARDAHYGICVDAVEDVERAITRLEEAGLVSSIKRSETCCYANQTKVWAIDPAGRRWEIYTVHEDTQERDDDTMTCCAGSGEEVRACCVA
jgi:predicted enzyme related to lactoylglutathione lyase